MRPTGLPLNPFVTFLSSSEVSTATNTQWNENDSHCKRISVLCLAEACVGILCTIWICTNANGNERSKRERELARANKFIQFFILSHDLKFQFICVSKFRPRPFIFGNLIFCARSVGPKWTEQLNSVTPIACHRIQQSMNEWRVILLTLLPWRMIAIIHTISRSMYPPTVCGCAIEIKGNQINHRLASAAIRSCDRKLHTNRFFAVCSSPSCHIVTWIWIKTGHQTASAIATAIGRISAEGRWRWVCLPMCTRYFPLFPVRAFSSFGCHSFEYFISYFEPVRFHFISLNDS